MPYIICNNNNYLLQDTSGFSIVNDINLASKWKKIDKANNVCKNISLNKKLNKYHLSVKYVSQENQIIHMPAKPIDLDCDILEKVKEISTFSKQLEERKLFLQEKIHEIELEIVDIEHAAEFYTLNASQGYKLYKLLHNARVQRREFKDELEKINLSLGTSMTSINFEKLERSILGLSNRKYTPRVNKELFGV